MHLYIRITYASSQGVIYSLEKWLMFFSKLLPSFPITTPRYKHPMVKLGCKIKIVLHIKGVTKTANRNRGLCPLKKNFFSSLYPNLMKRHFPSVFIYPLHLNILSQTKQTKG